MSIEARNLGHVYSPDTPFAYQALDGASVRIPEGKMTAIIGQTGSGKSTFVQHLNGLLVPTAGELEVLGRKILPGMKIKDLKELRRQVGLVFQFPEYQLFEETIGRDIAFGPKNFGVSEEDALEQVKAVLPVVGLDESYLERSPFDLSGGQKQRVAIARAILKNVPILLLDEATAAMDIDGKAGVWASIRTAMAGRTVVYVAHDAQTIANADYVVVLRDGRVEAAGEREHILSTNLYCREMMENREEER